jgi:MarR family transcriptional regulator, transcriptional regulator for hemolysin
MIHKLDFRMNLAFAVDQTARQMVFTLDVLLLKQVAITFAEWKVIAAIADRDQVIEKDIADKLRLNPSTLIPIIDRVEKKGFVERSRDAKDRRKIYVRMTDKALESWTQTVEIIDRANKDALVGISGQDALTVLRILNKISDKLEASRLSTKHLRDQINKVVKF